MVYTLRCPSRNVSLASFDFNTIRLSKTHKTAILMLFNFIINLHLDEERKSYSSGKARSMRSYSFLCELFL